MIILKALGKGAPKYTQGIQIAPKDKQKEKSNNNYHPIQNQCSKDIVKQNAPQPTLLLSLHLTPRNFPLLSSSPLGPTTEASLIH